MLFGSKLILLAHTYPLKTRYKIVFFRYTTVINTNLIREDLKVLIFRLTTLGRFTVCITPLVFVLHMKFHFLNHYSSISNVISGHSKEYSSRM